MRDSEIKDHKWIKCWRSKINSFSSDRSGSSRHSDHCRGCQTWCELTITVLFIHQILISFRMKSKFPSSVESLALFNGIEGFFWICASSQTKTRIPHSQEAIQDGKSPLFLLHQSIISPSYSTLSDGGKCALDRRKSRALLRRRRTLFFVDSVKTPPLRRYWRHLFLPSKRKHSLIPMSILPRISVVSIYLILHQKIPLTISPLLFSIESNIVSSFYRIPSPSNQYGYRVGTLSPHIHSFMHNLFSRWSWWYIWSIFYPSHVCNILSYLYQVNWYLVAISLHI